MDAVTRGLTVRFFNPRLSPESEDPLDLPPGVGSPAPDFTLNDIYGASHSLSDYSGRVIVLAFMTPT